MTGPDRGGRGRHASPDFAAEYLAEFLPTNGKPAAPCQCGDVAFYQLDESAPWRCRTCHPPGPASWRTVRGHHLPQCDPPEHIRSAICRWFVVSGIGQ